MECEEVDVSAIAVGCLNIKSEGVGQIFLVNDDGTVTTDNQLQCLVGEDGGEIVDMETRQFPIYDIGGQHFILDNDGHMQLLQSAGDGSVIMADTEEQPLQEELPETEELKYVVDDDNMHLNVAVDDGAAETVTQITLDEEQCRQLEQEGRVILQQDGRHYILDQWGLHEIAGNIDEIEEFHQSMVAAPENMIISETSRAVNIDNTQYEEQDIEPVTALLPEVVSHRPISLLQKSQNYECNVEGTIIVNSTGVIVTKMEVMRSEETPNDDSETKPRMKEDFEPEADTAEFKTEIMLPQQKLKIINEQCEIGANSNKDINDESDEDYIVSVSNIADDEEGHGTVIPFNENILMGMSAKAVKLSSTVKPLQKSVLLKNVLTADVRKEPAKDVANDDKSIRKSRSDDIAKADLKPLIQKYIQETAIRNHQAKRITNDQVDPQKKTSIVNPRHMQSTAQKTAIQPSPGRFVASESLQGNKKELQLFTSQYGISWMDDNDNVKLKLTTKLPSTISNLVNKNIPIGPLKSGKKLFARILSVVRPPSKSIPHQQSIEKDTTEKIDNVERSEDDVLESLIQSAILSSDESCTGEDLAATEKTLEDLMSIESVNTIMANRDVAVIKIIQRRKGKAVREVKWAVCGRMGVFSEPNTERIECKFMYMPDLIKRRTSSLSRNVEEFEVTVDGVPYRRTHEDGHRRETGKSSKRPLLQVRIMESTDELNNKDTKIVLTEANGDGAHLKLMENVKSSPEDLKTVIAKSNNGDMRCNICGRVFISMVHFVKHLSVEHRKKWVACSHCNRSFNRPSNLQRHLRIHSNRHKKSQEPNSLKLEPESQSSDPEASAVMRSVYKCDLCPCSYFFSSTLTRHIINTHILPNGMKEDSSLTGATLSSTPS